ncbi:MAG TPA: 2'-5' RNA ligase family protein [Mycobacterium sp.]|nr:2'-5' RNA ligase family protein [Mycobacterium sp.]
MVHSIELTFDRETEAAVRQLWDRLAEAGIPSQAPAARPHVTLLVGEQISTDVDALLVPLCQRLPLPCIIGAPVLFGRGSAVLARLVVPTAELLALHAEVHRRCVSHLAPGPAPHCVPGEWTAHVTLARHVRGGELGRALRIAGRPSQIRGGFAGLRRWDGDKRVEHPIGG